MDDLKYRIDFYLNQLSEVDYLEAVNTLPKLLEISRSQFNRIRKYTWASGKDTKTDYMIVMAKYFKCSIDDLINPKEQAA